MREGKPISVGASAGASGAHPIVAAFDFDGTLIRGDSFLPFLRLACGAQATARALTAALAATAAAGRPRERDVVKAAVLARLLAGRELAPLATLAEGHAQRLVATRMRPSMVRRLRHHQAAGHRVVVVSASPELYLGPVGRLLGVEAVLATRLSVGPDGRLTGAIEGRNCRGPEKCARLRTWLGDSPAVLHAYGDSAGDTELLAMAEVATWVPTAATLARRVVPAGSRSRLGDGRSALAGDGRRALFGDGRRPGGRAS